MAFDFLLLVFLNRNATAVVHYRDGVVRVDGHLDVIAEAGERLVDRVVDDLVHQVVQSAWAG